MKPLFYIAAIAIELLMAFQGFSKSHQVPPLQESPLSSGNWYKFAVEKEGVYKITYGHLQNMGMEVSQIDPKKIKIFGYGGGMLPQSNAAPRPLGMLENAIHVAGEADGTFGENDYIIFYAQGPDKVDFSYTERRFEYQKNLYADSAYYFLNVEGNDGLRISIQENEGLHFASVKTFDDYAYHEKDELNIIGSGREWYGEIFGTIQDHEFSFSANGLIQDAPITLISAVMGQAYNESSFDISLNGMTVGSQNIPSIPEPDLNRGINLYADKGANQVDTFNISSTVAGNGQLSVNLKYNKSSAGNSTGYLNFLFLHFQRELSLYGNQTIFQSIASLENPQSSFAVEADGANNQVWDITFPQAPKLQSITEENGLLKFGASTSSLKKFVVFNPDLPAPVFIEKVHNQNLHGITAPALLIVTHPSLLAEARRLQQFREANDGLKVEIVTTHQIYNEFSSGAQDITAIRDFVKFLYRQSAPGERIKNLLLFGKGSYDYKNKLGDGLNLVPTYESRNSLHSIYSYSSDDYFAFLDENEGEWLEENFGRNGDHVMDIGVGRLPVATSEEARIVVDKLINYASNEQSLGPWRNQLTFVADDEDDNLHQRDAERIATLVNDEFTQFTIKKIYLDAYPQLPLASGTVAPAVNDGIMEAVEKGSLIVNFTGHGSETYWTEERVLDLTLIGQMRNYDKLPLFVTATCDFARHDDPEQRSGGEYLILSRRGGAIGMVATTRPVFSNTNFVLNSAFFNEVFSKESGEYKTLGAIFKNTKNQSLSGSINRNFTLLGDPSMKLAYPEKHIQLLAVNESNFEGDTLKALSKITLQGEITNEATQTKITSFNGLLTATVYDKEQTFNTLGNGAPPFTYKERPNALFRGEVSVNSGNFEIEFVVPKNIDYKLGYGKINLYAQETDGLQDAGGAATNVIIGGSSSSAPADNTAPVITLYMENTSFVSGGITAENTLLLAKLSDENGINISNSGPGQSITATLDNEISFNLNEYYKAEKDDYTKGWLAFPLHQIPEGKHTLHLKAWDTHNNSSEAVIDFVVEENAKLSLTNVINYPNPFNPFIEGTTFSFGHNRQGENLEILLYIYTVNGEEITVITENISRSGLTINKLTWDGRNNKGKPVESGIYISKLVVSSRDSGLQNQQYQKLIVIN